MKKNDIIELKITGMTAEGNGIGRTEDGMAVFVPLTAIGDIVDCRIVKCLKSYAYGIIERLKNPSSDRIQSDCPVSEKCGGCTFRHISYEAELAVKDKLVRDAFERIGGFSDVNFDSIYGTEQTSHYRNKAQYPVAENDGKAVCGFYSKRSHRVVPFTGCLLQPLIFDSIASFCIDFVNENIIPAYNEKTGSGILRHIYIRKGHYSGEIMVCLVVTGKTAFDSFKKFGKVLIQKFPEIKSVIININPKNTNVILGNKNITLAGADTISDVLCGNKINLSPMSFYQVNTVQAEHLYSYAKECAAITGAETVLDLYCGAGTIGIFFADKAHKVIGGEIVPEAVENARENAYTNKISNIEFICGDAGKISSELADKKVTPDVIIIDPPRKGCDQLTLDSIKKMSPDRIVMISCNPATAARDAAYLCGDNYAISKTRAFDLFPRTGHVECVVLMSRKNG